MLIGWLQWLILRRHLPVPRWWILTVSAGIGLNHFVSDDFPNARDPIIGLLAGSAVVGVLQWLVLRKQVNSFAWWIVRCFRRVDLGCWEQKVKVVKLLSVIGLLSGTAVLILIAVVGDSFGFPGSAEYLTYEIFNRVMALLLALQTCALIALFIGQREVLGKTGKRMLTIALVAWTIMAIGTAAEFWLYSDLPYPSGPADFNMRRVAFTLFFLGSVIAGVALLVLGFRLLKSGISSRFWGAALMLYLPLFIAAFIVGPSIFVAPSLASIMIAGLALRSKGGAWEMST